MRKYEQYKDSGVEWIGEIPQHWSSSKLKYVAMLQVCGVDKKTLDGEYPVRLCNYLDVYKNEFITSDLNFMSASATDVEMQKYLLKRHDVLATKDSEDPNDIAVPALVKEEFTDVICAYHLIQMRANNQELVGSYLYYLFCTNTLRQYFATEASGVTRFGLSTASFNDLTIPLPKVAEQKKIAEYLENICESVQTCISKKQELIDLLHEEKAALINHAVTKGIDDTATMKPSGIEWLGDVPAHWEVKRLKYLADIKYGLGQPPKQKDGGLPLIRATNVDAGKIFEKDMLYVDPNDIPYDRDPVLKENDIIVVRSGAYTADSAIIPKKYEGAITGYDMVVRVREAIPKFISYAFLTNYVLINQLYLHRLRAAQPHLNREDLGETLLMLPSTEEQKAIVYKIE